MNKEGLKQLKKKLFVLAGYLLVTAALFVYVSYSQYKITITATVRMPEVHTLQAGISLLGKGTTDTAQTISKEENRGLTTDAAVTIDGFMDTLAPGNSASTYASTSGAVSDNHKLVVVIDNAITSEGAVEGEEPQASPFDIKYTLSITTDGVLPLEFIMYGPDGKNGNRYTAKTEHTNTAQAIELLDSSGKTAEFYLTGGAVRENIHEIYVGWNNTSTGNEDISLCKEVDKIVVTAHLTAMPYHKATYDGPPTVDLEHVYLP